MNEVEMLSQSRRDRIIERPDGVLARRRVRVVREFGGDKRVRLLDCDIDSNPVTGGVLEPVDL